MDVYTREQMLVFSFAYNLSCFDHSVRVGVIALTLVDGDVLPEMVPLSPRDEKRETAVSLLDKWTFESSSRAEQLRVFREAVDPPSGKLTATFLHDECLPNLSIAVMTSLGPISSCEECRRKRCMSTTEISRILTWLLPEESKLKSLHSLESAVCEAVLRSTFSHHSQSVQEVYLLLASAADVIDEDRIRAFAQLSNASLSSSNSGTETVSDEASEELDARTVTRRFTTCIEHVRLVFSRHKSDPGHLHASMMKLNPTVKRQRRLTYRTAMALSLRRIGNVCDDDAQRASDDCKRSLFDFAFKDVRHYWLSEGGTGLHGRKLSEAGPQS